MSTDGIELVALIAAALVAVAYLAARRRERRDRERWMRLRETAATRVADADPPRAPSRPAEALARAVEELKTARRLLEEVGVIGLWSQSDDSSDNRRRRQGLRESGWAVSGALRALTTWRAAQPDVPPPLAALEEDLRTLVGVLEGLTNDVTDTMGENLQFYVAVSKAAEQVAGLLERATRLTGEHGESGPPQ